jgi:hypothetical protein
MFVDQLRDTIAVAPAIAFDDLGNLRLGLLIRRA